MDLLDGPFTDFLDPWGNRVELTTYTNIQFTKADHVLRGMGWATWRRRPKRSGNWPPRACPRTASGRPGNLREHKRYGKPTLEWS